MTSGEELIEPVTASQLAEAVDLVASNGARAWGTREIDLSAVREFLRREQLKTPEHLPALFVVWVRASCEALAQVPLLNSRWTDDGIRAFKFVNLGIEVPTGRGRVVPVVKDADQLALQDLADALADLVQRAAAGYVSEKEISGGTFTVALAGPDGAVLSRPLLHEGQAGIYHFGRIRQAPVVINDAIAIRPVCNASLAFDHRILDGASSSRFQNLVKSRLESWS